MKNEMMNPLISVIIPVYKVEKYLHQCVDSVLKQSYNNIEIILVDDGSPDSCPVICDEYTIEDSRVRVIHKTNGGTSDARNAGINIATGEYIVFLDSDDFWSDEEAISYLVNIIKANKVVDIICFRYYTFFENEDKKFLSPEFNLDQVNGKDKQSVLNYLVSNALFNPSVCNKLVRKSILADHFIEFEKEIVTEDIDFNFALTLKADHFFSINENFYAYRQHESSKTHTIGSKNISDLISIIEKWSLRLQEECQDQNIKELLLSYCAYQLGIVMGFIYFIDKSHRKYFFSKVKKLSYLLEYDANLKTHKVRQLYNIFGVKPTCLMLFLFIKLKRKGLIG